MSEKKSTAVAKTKGNGAVTAPQKENGITVAEQELESLVDQLDDLQEGPEMTGDYYKFQPGDKMRCWVTGYKEMLSKNPKERAEGRMIKAIKLLGKFPVRNDNGEDTGETKTQQIVTAEAVIRSTLEKTAIEVENAGDSKAIVPVLIECTGSTTSANGDYKTFKIVRLSA